MAVLHYTKAVPSEELAVLERQSLPAVFASEEYPWYHFTCAKNVRGIKKEGLKVCVRCKWGDLLDPLGGLYITRIHLQHTAEFVGAHCRAMPGQRNPRISLIAVALRAGTRFCLDEDIIWTAVDYYGRKLSRMLPGNLWKEFLWHEDRRHSGAHTSSAPFVRRFHRLQKILSCMVAHLIPPNELYQWPLRIFDSPTVLGITPPFDDFYLRIVETPENLYFLTQRRDSQNRLLGAWPNFSQGWQAYLDRPLLTALRPPVGTLISNVPATLLAVKAGKPQALPPYF
jgi:hypothetical protein